MADKEKKSQELPKICPLLPRKHENVLASCLEERCAWWVKNADDAPADSAGCALPVAAAAIDAVEKYVDAWADLQAQVAGVQMGGVFIREDLMSKYAETPSAVETDPDGDNS